MTRAGSPLSDKEDNILSGLHHKTYERVTTSVIRSRVRLDGEGSHFLFAVEIIIFQAACETVGNPGAEIVLFLRITKLVDYCDRLAEEIHPGLGRCSHLGTDHQCLRHTGN